MIRALIFALLLLLVAGISRASAAYVFYYTSAPSAWVGQGATKTVTPSQGFTFHVPNTMPHGTYVYGLDFIIDTSQGAPQWWELIFAAPDTTPLIVGSYFDAQRHPFEASGHPGLWFAANGHGDNTLTGEFHVLELSFLGSTVDKFAVDFLQLDHGNASEWNWGSLRYNSDIPITLIPEPSTILLAIAAIALPATIRRRSVPHNRV